MIIRTIIWKNVTRGKCQRDMAFGNNNRNGLRKWKEGNSLPNPQGLGAYFVPELPASSVHTLPKHAVSLWTHSPMAVKSQQDDQTMKEDFKKKTRKKEKLILPVCIDKDSE